ncbi:MAG: ribosomal protein methylthiotransferase accessory factor [Frankiaceae bacterium]|nr:ribosomal protein methylthiotransferase accessory factor [Frankiaceae bacterium]
MTSPAEIYAAALPGGGAGGGTGENTAVEEFDLTGLDQVGVPFWSVSLHADAAQGRPKQGGQGFGVDAEAARTGAYGEVTEEYRSWASLSDAARREGSYAELRRELGDGVADPRTLCLEAGSDYDDDRPMQWLPMRRLTLTPDAGSGPAGVELGETVLVPAELVASNPTDLRGAPPAAGWLTTVITNGLGAGPDLPWAMAHGLLELLQRDGNGLRFRAMDAGVDVDLDALADPQALEVLRRLRAAGVAPRVKLASTDFGIPNVYAVGPGPEDRDLPIMTTACGEGTHPDRDRAVRKALLEYAASRARKVFMHGPLDLIAAQTSPAYVSRAVSAVDLAEEEHRALASMVEWLRLSAGELRGRLADTVLSSRSSVALTDLPSTPVAEQADIPALLVARLAEAGLTDVFVADLSPGDRAVSAAKVLVPGLEVETMSYGRVGERNLRRLIDAGRDDLAWVGEGRPGASPVLLTDAAVERLGGPGWVDRTALDRVVGGLYPLYREPSRHAAPLALAQDLATAPGGNA